MNTHLIELSGCAFGYAKRTVVRVEQLHLQAGKCLGVFGPNGAGKTTLVRGITGLLAPMRGSVHRPRRLRFGYLPQHRALELHWPMSGLDAAALAISARNVFGWLGAGRNKLRATMTAMGIDQLARRPFAKLSGGQQQRLLLAGALASDPQVLLLDEPTDGLDVRSREILLQNLRQTTDAGLCTVIISHDVEDLLTLCDEVAWLHRGEAEFDSPSHVELIAPELLAERVLASRKVS